MASGQSPPLTQDEEDSVMADSPASNMAPKPSYSGSQKNSMSIETLTSSSNGTSTSKSSKDPHGAPGSSWQNKKFKEEYDRAFAQLQDQKWSMSHFPDPLAKSR